MRSDAGFGLVDFLLAMTLGTILMLGITSVYQTGYGAVRAASDYGRGNNASQQVLQHISRDAHGGIPDAALARIDAPLIAPCPAEWAACGTVLRLGATEMTSAATGRLVYVAYRFESVPGTTPLAGQIVRESVDASGRTNRQIIARELAGDYAGYIFTCAPNDLAFTLTGSVTTTAAPVTVAVTDSKLLRVGTKLYVDYDNVAQSELVDVLAVPSLTQVRAVFTKTHAAGAKVSLNSCPSVSVTLPFRVSAGIITRTATISLRPQP